MSQSFGSLFGSASMGLPTFPTVAAPAGTNISIPAPGGQGGGLSGALDIFGSLFGGLQEAQQARFAAGQQAALLEANAALLEQRAREERVAANVEKARDDRRNRLIMMNEFARLSEAGGLSPTGYGALSSNANERELDSLTTRWNKHTSALQLDNQAGITRTEAAQVRSAGRRAGTAAMIGGFSGVAKRIVGGSRNPLSVGFGA